MQESSGHNAVPPSVSANKARILDVKPLRSLKPIFPPSNQAAPFVCVSPDGPFPPDYSSFYPFYVPPPPPMPEPPQPRDLPPTWATTAPTPTQSFTTPGSSDALPPSAEMENGDIEPFTQGKKRASRMRPSGSSQMRSMAMSFGRSAPGTFVIPMSSFQQETGNREMVDYVLMTYDGLRRRLSQLEDAKEAPGGMIRRADLKASNLLMTQGVRTNMRKRVGPVPGVEIGDIFFFRMEMCLVGLHSQSMGGIDYINVRGDLEEEPVALSVVSSGYYYDDDAEDKDVLIYSGQGGAMGKAGKPAPDQKLEKGNLALDRSMHRANEVRVIRGMPDAVNPNSKVYMYDGLYIIQQSWMEKAKSGPKTFKYKLVRVPGQPDAFAVWKTIQRWKEDLSSRSGLILPDLTSGSETIAVSLVNEVDSEKGTLHFTYFSTLKYSRPYSLLHSSYECKCCGACKPGDLNCSCVRKNGGDFPYTSNGVLVSRRPLVYECGPSCPCLPNCKNRVSQGGLKVGLEVFKTKNRGWGLRSCDPIRAGTFICEYAGEVIDKDRLKQKVDEGENDEYIFDTTRVYEPFKWNYEAGLLEDESSSVSLEEYNIPSPLFISAKESGNVARFMNHSCYPNIFWQPVIYGTSNESYLHIAFYALRHIPPMTELTYDYGVVPSEGSIGADYRKRKCLCGFSKCRGYFGL